MSTHARSPKSMAILGRVDSGQPPPSDTTRILECGHRVLEPDGGLAHLAQRAFCPVCAPKLPPRRITRSQRTP